MTLAQSTVMVDHVSNGFLFGRGNRHISRVCDARANLMLRNVSIRNFKSIVSCEFEAKRFNVFIGANGGGKSNLLEALALGLAAAGGTLENDSLVARGIRLSSFSDMCSRFLESSTIELDLATTEGSTADLRIKADTSGFNPRFERADFTFAPRTMAILLLTGQIAENKSIKRKDLYALTSLLNNDSLTVTMKPEKKEKALSFDFDIDIPDVESGGDEEVQLTEDEKFELVRKASAAVVAGDLGDLTRFKDFTIYSPERSTLLRRRNDASGPISTLGEGTLDLVQFLADHRPDVFAQLCRHLHTIDWFESIEFNGHGSSSDSEVFLRDKYVEQKFSSRSANEGFLLLLFYFVIILSSETPQIFAVENVDQSLNPRLCRRLAEELSNALRTSGKQAFVTIHNPVFLDGLDFRQNDIGLFIVKRNFDGHTIVRAVPRPERFSTDTHRLSQAFIDGQIGGLPENF